MKEKEKNILNQDYLNKLKSLICSEDECYQQLAFQLLVSQGISKKFLQKNDVIKVFKTYWHEKPRIEKDIRYLKHDIQRMEGLLRSLYDQLSEYANYHSQAQLKDLRAQWHYYQNLYRTEKSELEFCEGIVNKISQKFEFVNSQLQKQYKKRIE